MTLVGKISLSLSCWKIIEISLSLNILSVLKKYFFPNYSKLIIY